MINKSVIKSIEVNTQALGKKTISVGDFIKVNYQDTDYWRKVKEITDKKEFVIDHPTKQYEQVLTPWEVFGVRKK